MFYNITVLTVFLNHMNADTYINKMILLNKLLNSSMYKH